jgi:hypothetical protein
MSRLSCLVLGLAILAVGPAAAQDKGGAYVKDGKLTAKVEVLELQGGFAGFTGTYYTIEREGSWSTGPVLPRDTRGEPTAKGKLTADQLKALEKAFTANDLSSLPSHGMPETNPKVVTIIFGRKKSELQPKPAGKPEEDKAIRTRYAGIFDAVKAAAKGGKKE